MSSNQQTYMVWHATRERYYKPVIQAVCMYASLADAEQAYSKLAEQLTASGHFRDAVRIMNVQSAEYLRFAASYHGELGDCYAGLLAVRPV
jgi:hypothetical protein